jgi:hypothetical protein
MSQPEGSDCTVVGVVVLGEAPGDERPGTTNARTSCVLRRYFTTFSSRSASR